MIIPCHHFKLLYLFLLSNCTSRISTAMTSNNCNRTHYYVSPVENISSSFTIKHMRAFGCKSDRY